MQEFKEENNKSINNREEYLFNPLNGFALIRRMHYDWSVIDLYISPSHEKSEYYFSFRKKKDLCKQ